MASDIEELADALAQAAHDVRWAQDWRDVGDLLARFEQRARDAYAAWTAVVAERDRLRAQLELVTAENHARAVREAQSLEDWSALRAERDRLRAQLEALRDECLFEAARDAKGRAYTSACVREWCAARIDAILSGGES